MQVNDLTYIADKSGARINQCASVIEMLTEGMTVPFISRYRKERTGNLDEAVVNAIAENMTHVQDLNDRKKTILKTIEEQGKLDENLKSRIANTYEKQELEDLYLPFKPKRRTKATVAKEQGLEPLADAIWSGSGVSPEDLAEGFIQVDAGVNSIEDALAGAGFILAERFAEDSELRVRARQRMMREGTISVEATDDWKERRSKFEQYYEHQESLARMPSHRVLAIRRGEREKVLRSRVELDRDRVMRDLFGLLKLDEHPHKDWLTGVLEDALKRLMLPSIELDVRSELKRNADEAAISVFADNLENLLLAPPAGSLPIIAVDPGYRTGCKVVVLDETGRLLEAVTIYPTQPRRDTEGAVKTISELVRKYHPHAIVIGNGTASRESEAFIREVVGDTIPVSVISEAGASVYSASEVAREEFPDQDVTVRGAISIGRRFQDPLAELVKIDPKSIGVGQYQHDVNQTLLKRRLDTVVVSVVNRVGVDLNTASRHLLRYVSGIGDTQARNIVTHRDEHGRFRSRQELREVRMFGEKAFEQSAGFLRIREGESILDNTGIHPESYDLVENIAVRTGVGMDELIGNETLLSTLNLEEFVTDLFGIPTLTDIVRELRAPGRDPRQEFELFTFTPGVEDIADLEPGLILNGVVTNVTHFGAFVDVGVHQDGLVHISQLSHRYVQSPSDVVSVGQRVQVQVLEVDGDLKRISLSMKTLEKVREQSAGSRRDQKPVERKSSTSNNVDALRKSWGAD